MRIGAPMVEFNSSRCCSDHNKGHGVTIPSRSVIRMHVEDSKIPFGVVKFESKARRHDQFKTWAESILASPDMGKFLEELGMLRPIQYSLFMEVERNPVNLAFLVQGGRRAHILSSVSGRVLLVVGGCGNANRPTTAWQLPCGGRA